MKRAKDVFVFGTVVMDLIARAPSLPKAGETVVGMGGISARVGGKGFNQALFAAEAARKRNANTKVSFVGAIGDDSFGRLAAKRLAKGSVSALLKMMPSLMTGTGTIQMDDSGRNQIIVSLGANHALCDADLDDNSSSADILIAQLELSPDLALHAFRKAKHGAIRILNASPVPEQLGSSVLQLLDMVEILIINEVEARALGIDYENELFLEQYVQRSPNLFAVVVTLGPQGVVVATRNESPRRIPPTSHKALDAVGAGDHFLGEFAIDLINNSGSIISAAKQANESAGEYVSRIKPSFLLGEVLE